MNALVAPRAGSLAGHCADDLWTLWLGRGLAVGLAVALHLVLGWALYRLGLAQPPVPAPKVLHTEVVMLAPAAPSLAAVAAPPVVAQPVTAPPTTPRVEPSAPTATAPTSTPAPAVARPLTKTADLARQRVSTTPRPKAPAVPPRASEPVSTPRPVPAPPVPAAPSLPSPPAEPMAGPTARPPVAAAPATAETSSQQYLPISKQAPSYPARALDDGIEGDCTVEYRVDTRGHVQDPHVVGSCHPMFIRPSLAAASTFVYRPRMVGGQAVEVNAVRNTFHYRIDE